MECGACDCMTFFLSFDAKGAPIYITEYILLLSMSSHGTGVLHPRLVASWMARGVAEGTAIKESSR